LQVPHAMVDGVAACTALTEKVFRLYAALL